MSEPGYRVTPDRVFQTAQTEFVHQATGRRVSVFATTHLATEEYFEAMRDDANDRSPTAVVHREGLRDSTPEELAASGVDPDLYQRFSNTQHDLHRDLAALTGLTFQVDFLKNTGEDDWQETDMHRAEAIRILGVQATEQYLDGASRFRKLQQRIGEVAARQLVFAAISKASLAEKWRLFTKSRPEAALYDERTKHELAAIDRDFAAQAYGQPASVERVIALWGVEHYVELKKGLLARGFKQEGATTWRDAFTIPKIPLREMLRSLREAARTFVAE